MSNNADWNLKQIASSLFRYNQTRFSTIDHIDSKVSNNFEATFINLCASHFQSGWWYIKELSTNNQNNEYSSNRLKVNYCNELNGIQLTAPLKGNSRSPYELGKKFDQQILNAKWSSWTKENGEPRTIKNILLKIRPQ